MDIKRLQTLANKKLEMVNPACSLLRGDGSARQIYKITQEGEKPSVIAGVIHQDLSENLDFITITKAMRSLGIPAPEIFAIGNDQYCYLLEYLGRYNLAEQIDLWQNKGEEGQIFNAYKKVINWMPKIQFGLPQVLGEFFQNRKMGEKTYRADIEYWKNNFLARFGFLEVFTDDLRLEIEEHLLTPLKALPSNTFVYRDFQSRNFMWVSNAPVFIDYQSAFLGPYYYDLASMLYASRSGLSECQRRKLIRYYYEVSSVEDEFDSFVTHLYQFVLLRRLRSLGSYGFLGGEKKKVHFLNAIEPTLKELLSLLEVQPSLSRFKQLRGGLTGVLERWKDASTL